jgi:Helix-turn-helix domain
MKPLGEIIKEQNIVLNTTDPVTRGGFTQVPNFILRDPNVSLGAKVAFAMFLSYAWNNDYCFPGQDRLATDMGMSRSRVTEFIGELERAGLVNIQRRGLGKTNIYTVHFQVKSRRPDVPTSRRPDVGRPTSRSRQADIKKSTGQPPEVSRLTSLYMKNTQ